MILLRQCCNGHQLRCIKWTIADLINLWHFTVDGGFTQWTDWADCSTTCYSEGIHYRTRTCTEPSPKVDGMNCTGDYRHTKLCIPENLDICDCKLSTVFNFSTPMSHMAHMNISIFFGVQNNFAMFFFICSKYLNNQSTSSCPWKESPVLSIVLAVRIKTLRRKFMH